MKIIFFDIDGTLLDKGASIISPQTQESLSLLINNTGYDFSVATGRGWPGVEKLNLPLKLPVVTELGSKIIDPQTKQTLLSHKPKNKEVIKFVNQLKDLKFAISFWTDEWGRVIFSKDNEVLDREIRSYSLKELIIPKNHEELINIIETNNPSLLRFNYPFENIKTHGFDLEFHPFSSKKGFEITAKSIDKASGIPDVAKMLHIGLENIFLIGNSNRDSRVMSLLDHKVIVLDQNKSREKALESAIKRVLF